MRLPDHLQGAIDEASRLNGCLTWSICKNNHIRCVVAYNGQTRLVILSRTPSDWRVPIKVKCDVRRVIREMSI